MRSRSAELCVAALFTALLAVGSWIAVPSAVPFTLQTFVLYLLLLLLPSPYAFGCVAVYLLLGAFGLPVFAGFQGGIAVLCGPLGGFLFGFLLMTLVLWIVRPVSAKARLVAVAVANLLCYAVGAVWYSLYFDPSGSALLSSLLFTVVPFLPTDALKLWLAWQLSKRLKPHLPFSC